MMEKTETCLYIDISASQHFKSTFLIPPHAPYFLFFFGSREDEVYFEYC